MSNPVFVYDGFQWITLNVFLEIFIGILLAGFIIAVKEFFTEDFCLVSYGRYIMFLGIFIIGFIYPFLKPVDISFKNTILIISTIISNLIINYFFYLSRKEYLEADSKKGFFSRKFIKKDGYYESKYKNDNDNGSTGRFGAIIIGRSSKRSFFDILRGKDGLSENVRKGIYLHELGHTIFTIPMIIIESIIYYYCFLNIINFNVYSILIIATLFTAITLLAWLDELLADSISVLYGFKNHTEFNLFNLIGSLGSYSHPPIILRYLSYLSFIIVPAVGLYYVIS